jgi:predicted ATPase
VLSRDSPRAQGSLAKEPSRFIGRLAELDELAVLSGKHSRLVTVVGPAGIGKTRLALRHASAQRFEYQSAGGVWFCDLCDARDLDAMCRAVLGTLRVAEPVAAGDDAVVAVSRALAARRRALVVLDNVEQLLPDGARAVLAWLDGAPDVRLVVTSRQPLGLVGEELLELAPLSVPAPGATIGEAVDLFVDRLRGQRGSWAPGREELSRIGQWVRQLGGVPLAIELAAGRVEHVIEGEALHIELVARKHRAVAPARDSTRALERAFLLLEPWEKSIVAQCSVFRGGFTREAAEAVVDVGGVPGAPPVAEILQVLHRRCLLRADVRDAEPLRFTMCEGIRALAARVLSLETDGAAAGWRHARYYLDRFAEGAHEAAGRAERVRERDNLDAVLELGATAHRPELTLRAAIALDALSAGTGLTRNQLARLDGALCEARAFEPSLVAKALGVRAGALRALGRLDEALRDAQTALSLFSAGTDRRSTAAMHTAVGLAAFQLGQLADALEHHERALAICQEIGERGAEASTLQHIGAVHQSLGHTETAKTYYEAALALAVETGDRVAETRASMGLGSYFLECGKHEPARAFYERGYFLAREMGLSRNLRIVTGYLGILCFEEGLLGEAERYLESAAAASKAVGDVRVEGVFEGIRGAVLAAQDRTDEARGCLESANAMLVHNEFFRRVVAIHRGHLDLALARQARLDDDPELARELEREARWRIDAARRPDATEPPLVERSDDARIAVRILERSLHR